MNITRTPAEKRIEALMERVELLELALRGCLALFDEPKMLEEMSRVKHARIVLEDHLPEPPPKEGPDGNLQELRSLDRLGDDEGDREEDAS